MTVEHDGGGESGDDRQDTNEDNEQGSSKDERRRERLSRRAQAAEKRANDLESKNSELEDRLAELEGKAGSVDKVLEREQAKREKAEKERDEALGLVQSERANRRTGSLVERIASDSGVPATRIRGLLMAAKADDPDLDIAPEAIDDKVAKSFRRLLTDIDPDSFQSKETGRARPRPGPAPSAHARGLSDGERPSADRLGEWANHSLFKPPKDGRPV